MYIEIVLIYFFLSFYIKVWLQSYVNWYSNSKFIYI